MRLVVAQPRSLAIFGGNKAKDSYEPRAETIGVMSEIVLIC